MWLSLWSDINLNRKNKKKWYYNYSFYSFRVFVNGKLCYKWHDYNYGWKEKYPLNRTHHCCKLRNEIKNMWTLVRMSYILMNLIRFIERLHQLQKFWDLFIHMTSMSTTKHNSREQVYNYYALNETLIELLYQKYLSLKAITSSSSWNSCGKNTSYVVCLINVYRIKIWKWHILFDNNFVFIFKFLNFIPSFLFI